MSPAGRSAHSAGVETHRPPTRRLLRSRDDKMVAGVCGGLGEYTGIDPVVFRIVLAVAAFAGGAGLAAYVVAWICIPERNDDGSAPAARSGAPQIDNVAGIVLGVLGLVVLLGFVGGRDRGPFDGDGGVLLLLLVGGGLWWWVRQERDATTAPPVPPTPPAPSSSGDPLLEEAARLDDFLTTPVSTVPSAPPTPRPARSRLPLLGISALLLLWGGLVLVDLAVTEVDEQVAVGLSLVLVGGVFVLGAWYGRAGGLVVLGVLLAAVGGLSSVVDASPRGGFGERYWEASDASELRDTYRLGGGEAVLDLRRLSLTDDATVEVSVWGGELRVVLPADDDVSFDLDAHVGMGELRVLGRSEEGVDLDLDAEDIDEGEPVLTLDLRVGMGEMEVRRGAA